MATPGGDKKKTKRILSVQSSVVTGYVGNKSAAFALQLHGHDVSIINTVQLSNHTGYEHCKGQVLEQDEAKELFEGLKLNNVLDFSYVITGYMGSEGFLRQVGLEIRDMKQKNPGVVYVCDPCLGDKKQLFVREELIPIYHDRILDLVDILVPNEFELGVLTGLPIEDEGDAFKAMSKLHDRGVPTVVLSRGNLDPEPDSGKMLCLVSTVREKFYRIELPSMLEPMVGYDDLFTACLVAWLAKGECLRNAVEKAANSLVVVVNNTDNYIKDVVGSTDPTGDMLELRVVQSWDDILNPDIYFKLEVA